MSPTIFLSTVSSEFGELRTRLGKLMDRTKRLHARHEDDFVALPVLTLQMLKEQITNSTLVIHVIGGELGSVPPTDQVDALLARLPDFEERFPDATKLAREGKLTYTQWEFWLAMYLGVQVCSYQIVSRLIAEQRVHIFTMEAHSRYAKEVSGDDDLYDQVILTLIELDFLTKPETRVSAGLNDFFGAVLERFRAMWGVWGTSSGLSKYRKGVQNVLDLIEQPLLQTLNAPTSRSQLYIEQELSAFHEERDSKAATKKITLDELDEVGGERTRLFLTGEAGDGKSTVLKEFLSRKIAKAMREKRESRQIPAFLRLGSVFAVGAKTQHHEPGDKYEPRNAIFEAIVTDLYPFVNSRSVAHKLVEEALNNGELVVALDGLDECVDFESAISEIRQFCKSCDRHGNVIAITCRNTRLPKGLSEVFPLRLGIEPFDALQIDDFLNRWPSSGGRLASDLKAKLNASADVRAFCSNALILTLVVHLYLEDATEGLPFSMPLNRAKLYDRVFNDLLLERRENRGIPSQFTASGKRLILRQLAFCRFWQSTENPEHIKPSDLAQAIKDVVREPADEAMGKRFAGLTNVIGTGGRPQLTELGMTFLDELQQRDGLLIAVNTYERRGDGRATVYKTSHRSLLEFLAAEHAASLPSIRPEAMFERFCANEFNILLFYVSLMKSPSDVISLVNSFDGTDCYIQQARLLANAEALNDHVKECIAHTAKKIVDSASNQADPSFASNELQVLATLASRQPDAFEPAREQLRIYIERLAGGQVGGVELDRIIRAHPNPLLEILYELRRSIAAVWRAALVRGLAEQFKQKVGSLALRRVVGFLDDECPDVRHEAAIAIVRGLKEIPAVAVELRSDEAFRRVTEADAIAIWPHKQVFPSEVVYRIVTAANKEDGLFFPALVTARQALTWPTNSANIVNWKNAYHHLQVQNRIRRLKGICIALLFAFAFLIEFSSHAYSVRGAIGGKAFQFTFEQGIREIPSEAMRGLKEFRNTADSLIKQVRIKYPMKTITHVDSRGHTWESQIDNVPQHESLPFAHLKRINKRLSPGDRLTSEERSSIQRLGGEPALIDRFHQLGVEFDSRWVDDIEHGCRVPGNWIYFTAWYWVAPMYIASFAHLFIVWLFLWGLIGTFSLPTPYLMKMHFILLLCFVRTITWTECSGNETTILAPLFICLAGERLISLVAYLFSPKNCFMKEIEFFESALGVQPPPTA